MDVSDEILTLIRIVDLSSTRGQADILSQQQKAIEMSRRVTGEMIMAELTDKQMRLFPENPPVNQREWIQHNYLKTLKSYYRSYSPTIHSPNCENELLVERCQQALDFIEPSMVKKIKAMTVEEFRELVHALPEARSDYYKLIPKGIYGRVEAKLSVLLTCTMMMRFQVEDLDTFNIEVLERSCTIRSGNFTMKSLRFAYNEGEAIAVISNQRFRDIKNESGETLEDKSSE